MPQNDQAALSVIVSGQVQGVGFRYFTRQKASSFGLSGWVKNLPSGEVEAYAEGPRKLLIKWSEMLRKGPSLALVQKCDVAWRLPHLKDARFEIRT